LNPAAFIQIDLDGIWAVRKCYGLPEDDYIERDPVYEEGVLRFLELFRRKGVPASFFVVGRDAQVAAKAPVIGQIAKAGHEIGNHSFDHTLGLTRLSELEIRDNISKAQSAITSLLEKGGWGKEHYPVGFRSPGYDADARVLHAAAELGFLYDSSIFPTWWGGAMRLMDAYISGRIFSGKRQYGTFAGGLKLLAPHRVKAADLWEFPVSVSPILRLPFHFGVAFLRGFDYFRRCADGYLRRGIPLLYLFHGVDFVDARHLMLVPSRRGASFFNQPIENKLAFAERIIDYIAGNFDVQRARDYLRRFNGSI